MGGLRDTDEEAEREDVCWVNWTTIKAAGLTATATVIVKVRPQVQVRARDHLTMGMADTGTGTEGTCVGASDDEKVMGEVGAVVTAQVRVRHHAHGHAPRRSVSGGDSDTLVNAAFRYPGTRVERMEARRARRAGREGGLNQAPLRTAYEQNIHDNQGMEADGVAPAPPPLQHPQPYGEERGGTEQYDFYALEQEQEQQRGVKRRRRTNQRAGASGYRPTG